MIPDPNPHMRWRSGIMGSGFYMLAHVIPVARWSPPGNVRA
jgi:hypothetical protein